MEMNDLHKYLEKLNEIADPLKKRLWALALLTRILEKHNLRPILIGGSALEYYTLGGYTTKDVDVALPSCKEVDDAFSLLEFDKEGRFWVNSKYDLLFEAPASNLRGEEAPLTEVRISDLVCYIIGIEDLIIDRLNGFFHWHWEDDRRWVKRLLKLNFSGLDITYLRNKATEEGTIATLEEIMREVENENKES